MDSQFTDNDCVVSPKLVDKEPINKKVQDEKQSKDTKSELPKDNVVNKIVDKYKKVELQADSKTNVTQNETKSDNKDVQNAPIMKDKKQTSKTKRLVSVSEPLDKAMEQLSLALENGDVSFGMNTPDSPGTSMYHNMFKRWKQSKQVSKSASGSDSNHSAGQNRFGLYRSQHPSLWSLLNLLPPCVSMNKWKCRNLIM